MLYCLVVHRCFVNLLDEELSDEVLDLQQALEASLHTDVVRYAQWQMRTIP